MDNVVEINVYLRGASESFVISVSESSLKETLELLRSRPKGLTIEGKNKLELLVEEVVAFQVVS